MRIENQRKRLKINMLIACLATMLTPACSSFVYDPPPELILQRPQQGSFLATEPVRITASEPLDPGSFKLRIWDPVLDVEGLLPDDATPIVDTCSVGMTCDAGVKLIAAEDGSAIDVVFPEQMSIARPGATLLFEVLPGVADTEQNTTGRSLFYNVQFRAPEGRYNAEPVSFQNGTYIFSSVITDPVPAVLTLISDVVVMPDGRFFTAGGEGDEINGAPKETTNPVNLIVDPTDQGWSAHIVGFISLTEEGDRLLETDPIDIFLPTDPFFVDLKRVRLDGKIVKDEDGNDFLQGSLSFEQLILRLGSLDARPIEYEGGSQDLVGIYVKPEEVPANHPLVCGDQCGAIIGECDPPADFPDDDVCMSD